MWRLAIYNTELIRFSFDKALEVLRLLCKPSWNHPHHLVITRLEEKCKVISQPLSILASTDCKLISYIRQALQYGK